MLDGFKTTISWKFLNVLNIGWITMTACTHLGNTPSKPLEKEVKISLTSTQYKQLLTTHSNWHQQVQNNYYFDVPSPKGYQLQLKGLSLRIRLKKNKAIFTLKHHTDPKNEKDYFERVELECDLRDYALAEKIATGEVPFEALSDQSCIENQGTQSPFQYITQVLSLSEQLNIQPVAHSQTLRNTSQVKLANQVVEFELDHTAFSKDFYSYELEVELHGSEESINKQVKALELNLAKQGIQAKKSESAKSELALIVASNQRAKLNQLLEQGALSL